jgi:hypothetical protein
MAHATHRNNVLKKTQRGLPSVALQSLKNQALYFFRGLVNKANLVHSFS